MVGGQCHTHQGVVGRQMLCALICIWVGNRSGMRNGCWDAAVVTSIDSIFCNNEANACWRCWISIPVASMPSWTLISHQSA